MRILMSPVGVAGGDSTGGPGKLIRVALKSLDLPKAVVTILREHKDGATTASDFLVECDDVSV